MKPSQLITAINACMALRVPAFVWGKAGIGKSSLFAQIALAQRAKNIKAETPFKEGDAEFQRLMSAPLSDGTYFGLCDIRTLYFDTVDFSGLPYNDNGVTRYCTPPLFPRDSKWRGIILLDEFNSAPSQVQAIGYQLFNNRRINEYGVPEGAFLFAAGNQKTDLGTVHRTPDPVLDRWFNLYLEHDMGEWCQWALARKPRAIRPKVVAGIRFREAWLHSHDPQRQCHAFATPRGWEHVSDLLEQSLPEAVETDMIKGRLGDAVAGEFVAFLKLYRALGVSPDAILANPTTAKVPTNPSATYALAEALARRATVANFDKVMTYAKRLPKEYAQCLVSAAVRNNEALQHTAEFIAWSTAQAA